MAWPFRARSLTSASSFCTLDSTRALLMLSHLPPFPRGEGGAPVSRGRKKPGWLVEFPPSSCLTPILQGDLWCGDDAGAASSLAGEKEAGKKSHRPNEGIWLPNSIRTNPPSAIPVDRVLSTFEGKKTQVRVPRRL